MYTKMTLKVLLCLSTPFCRPTNDQTHLSYAWVDHFDVWSKRTSQFIGSKRPSTDLHTSLQMRMVQPYRPRYAPEDIKQHRLHSQPYRPRYAPEDIKQHRLHSPWMSALGPSSTLDQRLPFPIITLNEAIIVVHSSSPPSRSVHHRAHHRLSTLSRDKLSRRMT